jgi:hypothetical protein
MANGIVYILTNPCLDGWVKIGHTDYQNCYDFDKDRRYL